MSGREQARPKYPARVAILAALSLAVAGLPSSALADAGAAPSGLAVPSAAMPGTISGRVVLGPDADGGDFDVAAQIYDDGLDAWLSYAATTAEPDGAFLLTGLDDSLEYRLFLDSYSSGYLGGYYTGPGVEIAPEVQAGTPVSSPKSDVELHPVKATTISGSINLPSDFDWMVGGVSSGFDLAARELSLDGTGWLSNIELTIDEASNGNFEISRARTGAAYVFRIHDPSGRFADGYYHAGAPGLVMDLAAATPVMAGSSGVQITVSSSNVTPVLSSLSAPKVSGPAVVGKTLTATAGAWSLFGVGVAHQWLRNGTAIAGATASSYTLTPADAGAKVAVRVTASKVGFTPVVVTSAPTTAVAKAAAPSASKPPVLSGTARLGATLRASTGAWSVPGVKVAYQWLRNGSAIKGATSARYRSTTADVGKSVSVRATASLAGHFDGVSSSSAKKVAKGKPKVKAKAKAVKASKRARVAVRVKVAGLTKPTGTVTVKYGKETLKVKLVAKRKGKIVVRLPKLARGTYKVTVTYKPNAKSKRLVAKAKSKKVTLRVR